MSENQKSPKPCGKCFWSAPIKPDNEHHVQEARIRLDCDWIHHHPKIPICVHTSQTFVYADEDLDCPCFENKT